MGSWSAHQSDEMIVFLRRESVSHDGTDWLRIGLAGSIETETDFYKLVLQISIDGLRTAYYSNIGSLAQKILSQQGSVGVRVISSYDDQSIEFKWFTVLEWLLKLLGFFYLISTTADHVESSPIFEVTDVSFIDFNIVSCEYAFGAIQEPEKLRVLMNTLNVVVYADDHIVASGCLTSWQHTTHTNRIDNGVALSPCFEVDSLDSLLESMRKYGCDFRSDSSINFDAFEGRLVEDEGSAWLIVGSIFVEIWFLVFVAHVGNKINDKIRCRFGASNTFNNKSDAVIKQRLGRREGEPGLRPGAWFSDNKQSEGWHVVTVRCLCASTKIYLRFIYIDKCLYEWDCVLMKT
jgi:hypothetical protein